MVELYPHQQLAIDQLKSGSILKGGVGSGKSLTALGYYITKVCGGSLDKNDSRYLTLPNYKPLYIITTAKKRDSKEWRMEMYNILIDPDTVVVDSWNNISKYTNICGAFFIFDEDKVCGYGSWAKSFFRIAKDNQWIVLTATPGDTWLDYCSVFIANGFYKNRTDFIRQHVVYVPFLKYPKIDHYENCAKLVSLRDKIMVNMEYVRPTERHYELVDARYDKDMYYEVSRRRWNIFEERPIRNGAELCAVWRKVVNSSPFRIMALKTLIDQNPKLIVFYNFDYELEIIRQAAFEEDIYFAELNGHKHMDVPAYDKWVYAIQYNAGAEAWNCTETNAIAFYSLNYSYKIIEQSCGRIDRANTPFKDLYYYFLVSDSPIDRAILKILKNKETFNEERFALSEFA